MNEINSQLKINIPIKKNSNNVYSKKLQGKVVYSDNKLNIIKAGGKLYILDSNGKKLPEGSIVNLLFNNSNDLKELKNAIFTKALGNLTNNTLHIELSKNLSFNIDISNIPNIQKGKLLMWISEFSETLKESFSKSITQNNELTNNNSSIETLLDQINPEKQKQVKGFIRSVIDDFSKNFLKSKLIHPSPSFIAKKVEQLIKDYIVPKNNLEAKNKTNNQKYSSLPKKLTESAVTTKNKEVAIKPNNNTTLNKNTKPNIENNKTLNKKNTILKEDTFKSETEKLKIKEEPKNSIKTFVKKNNILKNTLLNSNEVKKNTSKNQNPLELQKQKSTTLEKNIHKLNIHKLNIHKSNVHNLNINKLNTSKQSINKEVTNKQTMPKNNKELNNKTLNIENEESKVLIKKEEIIKLKKLIRLPQFKKYKKIIMKKNIKEHINLKQKTLLKKTTILIKKINLKTTLTAQSIKNKKIEKQELKNTNQAKHKLISQNNLKVSTQKITILKNKNFKLNFKDQSSLKKQNAIKSNALNQTNLKKRNISITERLNLEQLKQKEEEQQTQKGFKKNILTINKTMEKAISAYKTMENSKNINDTSYMMFNILGMPVFMSFKKSNELHNNKESSTNYGKLRLVLPTETFGITDVSLYISEKDVILKIGLDKNEEIFKSELDKLSTNIEKLGYKLNSLNIYKNEKDITVKENIF